MTRGRTVFAIRFEQIRTLLVLIVAAGFLAACAGGAGGRGPGGPGGDRSGPPRDGMSGAKYAKKGGPRGARGGELFFSQALAFKNDGACDEAVPLFRRLADMGYGYEIAQFHLGDCLLMLAAAADDASQAELHQFHALYWLLKAGNSNNADAQGRLAALYLDGEIVDQSRVDAAKWYLLYMRNPIQLKIGAAPLRPGLERYLLDELRPQEWAAAMEAADAWTVITQEINRPQDGRPPSRKGGSGREAPRRLTERTEAQLDS